MTIQNYRALENIEITFNENMNLIYGCNAVGKTSIMQLVASIYLLNNLSTKIPESFQIFHNQFYINRDKPVSFCVEFINGKSITITRPALTKSDADNDTFSDNNALEPKENKRKEYLYNVQLENKLLDGTYIEGDVKDFYNTKFIYADYAYKEGGHGLNSRERLKFVEERFRIYYAKELQIKLQDSQFELDILKLFRSTLKQVNPLYEDIKVDYQREHNPLTITKNNIDLDMDQLSAGERCLILLLGRLCFLRISKEDAPSIIIDEIDISLHPTWQSIIIDTLKKALPNAQYFISSHSPFVWMGAAKEEIIYLVKDEQYKTVIKEIEYAEGANLESIAMEFFSLNPYNAEITDQISLFDELLAKKDFKKAHAFIKNFEENYGIKNPTLTKLRTRLRVVEK